jgi:ABC-type nitrate/sulfonate/bicarbonate transport system permease component
MAKAKRTSLIQAACWLGGFVFFVGIWALIALILHKQGNTILPYPHESFVLMNQYLWTLDYAENTWIAIGWTLARLLIGFSVSFVLGAILGTLGGLHKKFASFLAPYVLFSKTMPTAAFVLVLVGMSFSWRSLPPYIPCFLVFMVAFPLIYEAFKSGIENESPETKDALELDSGKKSPAAVLNVLWPDSESYILLSIAQSLGLSMKVSVMSEILVNSSQANGGIGGLIQNARYLSADDSEIIAYSLIAILMVLLIDIPMVVLKKSLKVGLN